MKVIMLKDVAKVGKKDQVVEVSDGYARNFLINRGLAVAYTNGSKKVLEKQEADYAAKQEQLKQEAMQISEQLKDIKLVFHEKAGAQGRMCKTISTKQIVEELKKKHDITIDKKKFVDKNNITAFGISRYKVELYKGVFGEVVVQVFPIEEK